VKIAHFLVITQRVVVNSVLTFRDNLSTPSSRVRKFCIPDPWRWVWEVAPKRRQWITTTRFVMTQRSAVLNYFSAEAWNHI